MMFFFLRVVMHPKPIQRYTGPSSLLKSVLLLWKCLLNPPMVVTGVRRHPRLRLTGVQTLVLDMVLLIPLVKHPVHPTRDSPTFGGGMEETTHILVVGQCREEFVSLVTVEDRVIYGRNTMMLALMKN